MDKYFNEYIKPYFNIQKVCTSLAECGYKQISFCNGTSANSLLMASDRIFFTTTDGFGFSFVSKPSEDGNKNWAAIRVDINGAKGPNKQGRDIFLLTMFENGGIQPANHYSTTEYINSQCSKNDLGDSCLEKIMRDGWQFSKDYTCW